MIYFGTYQHSLDAKNRLLIPSKLKALLTSTVYIMKGFDGCLSVFDANSFQNYVEKLQKLSFNHAKEREFLRVILSSVVEMEADKVEEMIGKYEQKAIREDICIKKAVDFVVANAVEK